MQNKIFKKRSFIKGLAVLFAVIGLLSSTAFAATITITTGSGVSEGLRDHGDAWLQTGDLVQIIKAGPDGIANDPNNLTGEPGGDDTILLSFTLTALPGSGKFTRNVLLNQGEIFYVRAWDAGTFGAATYYGQTTVATVPQVFDGYKYDIGAGFYTDAGAPIGSSPATPPNLPGFDTDTPKPVPQPTITRNPASFTLSVTQGQNLTAQTFTVGNTGSATLNYVITKTDASSIISNISPANGSITSGGANQTITLNFSTAALATGTYNATITITDATATNNPQTIPITLTVNPPAQPTITRNPASFTLSVTQGQALAAQTFTVGNSGSATLNYVITKTDASSIISSFSPANGSITSGGANQTITLNFSTAALATGTYNATITITDATATNNPQTIPITLTVNANPPVLNRTPASLTFSAVAGGANPNSQNISITNTGGESLNWTASKTANWLNISSASGTAPSTITVSLTTGALTAGTYNDTISINSNGGNSTVSVTFTVTAIPQPTITRNPASFILNVTQGQNLAAQTFTVGNSGSATLNYVITKTDASSIISSFSPANGSIASGGANQTITLNFSTAALVAGTYNATITITDANATNNPQTIPIAVTVSAAALDITTTSLPDGTVGTAYSQTLAATGGTTPYTWSISQGTLPTGLTLSGNTISGLPTTAELATFTVRVTDAAAASDTQQLTLNIAATSGPTISGITPTTAYLGQTIVISGSRFGATIGSSTVTIGGATVTPTAWSDTSITAIVPSGAASGTVIVTVSGQSVNDPTLTVDTSKTYIDDFDGGAVGTFTAPAISSGYYVFDKYDAVYNPTVKTTSYPSQEIVNQQSKVQYSYGNRASDPQYSGAAGDWGGGWGAKLVNVLNLSGTNYFYVDVQWDGSSNSLNVAIKDSDGTSYKANVPASRLNSLALTTIALNRSDFTYDAGGSDTGSNSTLDWTKVAGYNFIYNDKNTCANYQLFDNFRATVSAESIVTPPTTGEAPYIASLSPAAAPTGVRVSITGANFGGTQGDSKVLFTNIQTGVSYPAEIVSWTDGTIEAIVPRLAVIGNYQVNVKRIFTQLQGAVNSLDSNPAAFQVTAVGASDQATVYPNPFNPQGGQVINIVFTPPAGVTNIGVYIFDMTARLVAKQVIATSQTSWDGRDLQSAMVGDGAYLVRVVNEDNKSLIAKAKILVVKR